MRSLLHGRRRVSDSASSATRRRAGRPAADTLPLPKVVVLATGGTIAGAATSNVQAGYSSGQVGVDQLLNAVPRGEEAGQAAAASRSRTSARRT